jgi:TolB protein
MRLLQHTLAATVLVAAIACARGGAASGEAPGPSVAVSIPDTPNERHLSNLRRSPSAARTPRRISARRQWITFQSTRDGRTCDQQYVMRADGTGCAGVQWRRQDHLRLVLPGGKRLFFGAVARARFAPVPPSPIPSQGYVWGLDPYDIYTANRDGKT